MQRPRPVITAASITGLATSLAGILGFLGYANASAQLSGEAQVIGSGVIFLIGAGSHLVSALSAQNHVTPLSDPRNALGQPLSVAAPPATGGQMARPSQIHINAGPAGGGGGGPTSLSAVTISDPSDDDSGDWAEPTEEGSLVHAGRGSAPVPDDEGGRHAAPEDPPQQQGIKLPPYVSGTAAGSTFNQNVVPGTTTSPSQAPAPPPPQQAPTAQPGS